MRKELSGPNPTPLEKLLVQRVVATWLQVQHAELAFSEAEGISLALGDYYQRRMDHAHRRHLTAIRTLATVRKLALPVLMLNVAAG
jgi:hypothetical protein